MFENLKGWIRREWGDTVGTVRARARIAWQVVQICGLVAALVLFNAFPERVGVYVSATDPASFVPLLAPGFGGHLAWLNVWWGLALWRALVRLVYGGRRAERPWVAVGMRLLGIYVLSRLILGGPIVRAVPGAAGGVSLGWLPGDLTLDAQVKAALGLWLCVLSAGFLGRLVEWLEPGPAKRWDAGRAG